jgi:prefoldin subunit 5
MQAILENKIIEISELKQILQAEIHALEGKPKHLATIKNNILSLIDIIKDLKSVFGVIK